MYQSLSNEENRAALLAEMMPVQGDNRPTSLGAYIFGGAFSIGMEQAGFRVVGHLENTLIGGHGVNTSRQRWPVFDSDVSGWQSFIREAKAMGAVPNCLHMNPPCVAYAGTGNHKGTSDERMCHTRWAAFELGLGFLPDVWTWELVPGIVSKEPGFLEMMAYAANRHGYQCYGLLTSSALHGGFQDRRRFHFVASRFELDFAGVLERDEAEHKGGKTLKDALDAVRIARRVAYAASKDAEERDLVAEEAAADCLGILPNDKNLYNGAFRSMLPFLTPGLHLRDLPDEAYRRHYRPHNAAWDGIGRPGFAHTRGRMDRPSPNIMGGHTIFHPVEDRYITPRESATIQGFPIDWKFPESTRAYAEVGQGLCTHNASYLGRVLIDGLRRGVSAKPDRFAQQKLKMIDFRPRVPTFSLTPTKKEQFDWLTARGVEDPATYVMDKRAGTRPKEE